MMDNTMCSHSKDTVKVEKDEILGAYVAVKECQDCDEEVNRVVLGASGKYVEWDDEDIRNAF